MKSQKQNKIFLGRPSFNKIQSWLQETDSIEQTQRMLLNGGNLSRTKQSKLKKILNDNLVKQNQLEVNNSTKIMKISQFQDVNLSKTFAVFRKINRNKDHIVNFSQKTSPRLMKSYQKDKRQIFDDSLIKKYRQQSPPRQMLRWTTKQLTFKMKRIKRVQSASLVKYKQLKQNYKKTKFQVQGHTQLHTQLHSKQSQQINIKVNNRLLTISSKQNLQHNNKSKGKFELVKQIQEQKNPEENIKKSNNVNKIVEKTIRHKIKVDPIIKLQLTIASKLYKMENQK